MAAEDYIDMCYDDLDFTEEEPVAHSCGEACDVLRRNRETGAYFIGCAKFPKCRYTRPLFFEEDFARVKERLG